MNPVAWAVLAGGGYVLILRARNRRQMRALQRELSRQRRRLGMKAVAALLAVGAVVALLSHPKPTAGCPARSAATESSSGCAGGH